MNQSKSSGSAAAGPHASSPAKAATPAAPSGIAARPVSGKPLNAPVRASGAAAPRPMETPTRPAAATAPKTGTAAAGAARESVRSGHVQPGHTQAQAKTGKVVHDERGNAMWDWLKQTGRNAIESTTRMLRKLETPELQVEQTHEEELRIQPDGGSSAGGGYDPYNQPIKPRRTPGK